MMVSRKEVVRAARAWIGTPYVHQASCRGAGTDCLGLVRGVWRELFHGEPEIIPNYSRDWSEAEGREELWTSARRHLTEKPRESLALGDVILFRMKEGCVAKHLGIVTQTGPSACFTHAYSGHSVIESPLSAPWRKRIVALFEFPRS
ncbi:NlpC/P60 family protein [Shimia aestuarii]|uniref:Putative phage cell wall peptidase, NlpC/P60 family n=1 Tax=Shimia aestuarii TaxID=254406 RepID=A0A1I4PIX5_9RHOB|nr:NlpC/P60 family protein [Shimia aestuarii]SFM27465.1 putative phage cell wall peptidase, NlpC/P60 family [Shimia aestuarii]